MTEKQTVGFIGFGAMAKLMAENLRKAGYAVMAYTPSGSEIASPRALAEASDMVLVSVPNDQALEESAYGEEGFLAGLKEGGLVIDTSSVSPEASRRLAKAGEDRGIAVLDAPVSGSTPEAEKAELVVLIGGKAEGLERARPVLDAIGKKTIHVGPAGHGSTIKLVINGIMVSSMAAIAEGVGYGVAAGLDRGTLLQTLSGLAVVSPHHQRKIETAGAGDLSPEFPTTLAHKDLGLLLADAAAHAVPVPTIAAATQLLSLTLQKHAEEDYSAVLPTAERLAGG